MSIQTALRSLPSKPVLFIAPLVMAAVLCWHYYDVYRVCSHRAASMVALDRALDRAASGKTPFIFEDVFPAEWDTVRVFQGYKPDTRSFDCPLGWHFSEEERESIARQGDLTVIAFYRNKSLIDFADYRSSRARFSISDSPIERKGIAFAVTKDGSGGGYLVSQTE